MIRIVTGTILLVEDHRDTRECVEQSLTASGYTVRTAVNGMEAVNKLKAIQPDLDLVLLDILLPWLTGIDVLKAMARDSRLSDLPVIVVTGSIVPDAMLREHKNVKCVLRKPFDGECLVGAVNQVLCGRKA